MYLSSNSTCTRPRTWCRRVVIGPYFDRDALDAGRGRLRRLTGRRAGVELHRRLRDAEPLLLLLLLVLVVVSLAFLQRLVSVAA